MEAAVSPFPDDADALKELLATALLRADEAEQRAASVEAELANARALASATEALIAHLKLQNAKLRREQFGPSAERTERLLAQFELRLEDLEADAAEDELAAEAAAAMTATVSAFQRRKPFRKPFPDHLPRERVVVPAPCSCPACGGGRLSKLGEDITETLEVIPRSWKVIQTVREQGNVRVPDNLTHRLSFACESHGHGFRQAWIARDAVIDGYQAMPPALNAILRHIQIEPADIGPVGPKLRFWSSWRTRRERAGCC